MSISESIPIEITQNIIFKYCDGDDQINIKNIFYDNKLTITDLYNISNTLRNKLSDKFLKNHRNVKKLDASNNPNITDAGIQGMNIHVLDARCNPNITDK